MRRLLAALLALMLISVPVIAVQAEDARDALQTLINEGDAAVIAYLHSQIPEALGAVAFAAALTDAIGDVDPSDSVALRWRVEDLVRDTPDSELYGLLVEVARHRVQSHETASGVMMVLSAARARGKCAESEDKVGDYCCRRDSRGDLACRPRIGDPPKEPPDYDPPDYDPPEGEPDRKDPPEPPDHTPHPDPLVPSEDLSALEAAVAAGLPAGASCTEMAAYESDIGGLYSQECVGVPNMSSARSSLCASVGSLASQAADYLSDNDCHL